MRENNTFELIGKEPKGWQTKFQGKYKLPFPFPWLIFGIIWFFIGFSLSKLYQDAQFDLRLIALKSALIAAIANAVVYYEMILNTAMESAPIFLDEKPDKVEIWKNKWYHNIFKLSSNISTGMALSIICLAAGYKGYASSGSIPKAIYFCTSSALIGFIGGSMLWVMLQASRMTSSLGKSVKIQVSIFNSETSTMNIVTHLMWKIAFIASAVYVLGISAYFGLNKEMSNIVYIIAVAFGVFVVLYFIIPQINIHKTLLNLKRERLRKLVDQIDKTFDEVATGSTLDNISRLRDLFNLQRTLNGKSSWAFGTKELILLLSTVLVPLGVVIINQVISD